MIDRVRIDDVLWASTGMAGKEQQKFTKYVNWCRDADLYVVPNILCQDLDRFPECKEWIRQEYLEGRFTALDLHGWDHGPYKGRSTEEISEHLDQAFAWFDEAFDTAPIRWVTPHGADSPEIRRAAAEFGLIVETTAPPVIDQKAADGKLKQTRSLDFLQDAVIMTHWWERGLALYRLTQCIKAGSVDRAIDETRDSLDKKSWRICWESWLES
jgi:hypothetical protein